ncbi:hypothetical protein SUGI_0856760 [Cryptomeria japonica]|nr:hypothetical protein SUGI_0856760 [Cryptomeria japonica]
MAFLKRCRDSHFLPVFVKVSHHLRNAKTRRIFHRMSLALLRSVIQSTKFVINSLNMRLLPLHLELASSLRPDVWFSFDTSSHARALGRQEECIRRQKKKFEALQKKSTPCRSARSVVVPSSSVSAHVPSHSPSIHLSNPASAASSVLVVFSPLLAPPCLPGVDPDLSPLNALSIRGPSRPLSPLLRPLSSPSGSLSSLSSFGSKSESPWQSSPNQSSCNAISLARRNKRSPALNVSSPKTSGTCIINSSLRASASFLDLLIHFSTASDHTSPRDLNFLDPIASSSSFDTPAHPASSSSHLPSVFQVPACILSTPLDTTHLVSHNFEDQSQTQLLPRCPPRLAHPLWPSLTCGSLPISCGPTLPLVSNLLCWHPWIPLIRCLLILRISPQTQLLAHFLPRLVLPLWRSPTCGFPFPLVAGPPSPLVLNLLWMLRCHPSGLPNPRALLLLIPRLQPRVCLFSFLVGKRGLGFAVAPRGIPYVDFPIEIENLIRSLPEGVAEEVRQDFVVALGHAKPPKSKILRIEHLAFNELMKNNDAIITKADKGNAKSS